MKDLTTEEIRRAVRGRWRRPAMAVTVEGVSTDSRSARPGDLFVALRGEKFDGHDFLAQAAAAGCIAAVVDRDVAVEAGALAHFGGGVIGVQDTTAALGELGRYCRDHFAASVIAVTGSNGKTTVKRMIHHILSRRLRGRCGPKSFNNAVGVPLTIFSVAPADDYVVCEIGSNAPGEIAALARIARPDVAVITSVAEAHLEKLIDLEHVAAEKAALLGGLSPGGLAVVWADSPALGRAMRAHQVRSIRFGRSDSAELRLTGYEAGNGVGRFELNGRLWVDLPVAGRHNAVNALAAMAVAQRFGFDQDEAAAALGDYVGEEMRLQPVKAGAVTIVNDAYNANPASMRAAVEALECFAGKRTVVVAGDMLELGPRSLELHRQTGRALAQAGVNLVVGVGRLGRHIAAAAGEAGADVEEVESVETAAASLPAILKRGDLVLLKGSRRMAMERLVEPIRTAFKARPSSGRRRRAPVRRKTRK